MIVLGIDPGTAIVGYAFLEYSENKYNLLEYACIYTDKSLDMPERLCKIYNELDVLIKKYKPEYIAVEELFYFKNNKTVISVAQARGVILLCAKQNNLKIEGYTPLQVKMGITGYGKAEKKQVQEMVKMILKLKEIPKPDDAADAIAIAITHINSLNSFMPKLDKNLDLSKKITSNKMTAEEYRKLMRGN